MRMKVLLVSGNREEINMKALPLGLALVAEATRRAGHEVRMVDLLGVSDLKTLLGQAINEFSPQVIGISVRNIDDQVMAAPRFLLDQAREVVDLCRLSSRAPIVLGGAGYSIFPASALAYLGADMGLAGEGEHAFPLLLERLGNHKGLADVPGLYLPGSGLQAPRAYMPDLDLTPLAKLADWFPEASEEKDLWLPIQSRRGCPLCCSYCSTPLIEGKIIRRRSVDDLVRGLAALMRAGFQQFYFTDNVFNLPPSYAKALCRGMAGLNPLPRWRAILYPGGLDEELITLMARAGCVETALGFESGSPGMLKSLDKRFALDEVRQARSLLAREGVRCMGFLMMGGPGETQGTVSESLAFADSLTLDMLKITIGIRIYPQTPLARKAIEKGIVTPEDDLLEPRFYLERDLADWLPETVAQWRATRPRWLYP
jgi:radical SAM superfamily enzyme YgiQ (UPF0313 family)